MQVFCRTLVFEFLPHKHFFTWQPRVFPDSTSIDPNHPKSFYGLRIGTVGFHSCLGISSHAEHCIVEIVKGVFGRKNLRRAVGDAGKLAGFSVTTNERETNVYLTSKGSTSPWPGSMHLVVSGL